MYISRDDDDIDYFLETSIAPEMENYLLTLFFCGPLSGSILNFGGAPLVR